VPRVAANATRHASAARQGSRRTATEYIAALIRKKIGPYAYRPMMYATTVATITASAAIGHTRRTANAALASRISAYARGPSGSSHDSSRVCAPRLPAIVRTAARTANPPSIGRNRSDLDDTYVT
jgi:hypothetical protein